SASVLSSFADPGFFSDVSDFLGFTAMIHEPPLRMFLSGVVYLLSGIFTAKANSISSSLFH
ncbi:MAG TPA: hypothetical protein PKN70_00205, partial [Smithellaceae bacterium]|nr:hypothetical protein [Smithellaceae bacterium]